MARIKIDQPEPRPEDHYPTPEVPGIKPNPKDTPSMRAVGICKKDGQWFSYSIEFKGDKIQKIDYSEPDIFLVARYEVAAKLVKIVDKVISDTDNEGVKDANAN